jgi:hypothetical protein
MTYEPDEAVDVLRSVWAADGTSREDLDEACGPAKVCRNMRDFTFEGMADGGDVGEAWRETLRREGKLSTSGSLRDLVLGAGQSGPSEAR